MGTALFLLCSRYGRAALSNSPSTALEFGNITIERTPDSANKSNPFWSIGSRAIQTLLMIFELGETCCHVVVPRSSRELNSSI